MKLWCAELKCHLKDRNLSLNKMMRINKRTMLQELKHNDSNKKINSYQAKKHIEGVYIYC